METHYFWAFFIVALMVGAGASFAYMAHNESVMTGAFTWGKLGLRTHNPGPICGNGLCEGDEATTCPQDCATPVKTASKTGLEEGSAVTRKKGKEAEQKLIGILRVRDTDFQQYSECVTACVDSCKWNADDLCRDKNTYQLDQQCFNMYFNTCSTGCATLCARNVRLPPQESDTSG